MQRREKEETLVKDRGTIPGACRKQVCWAVCVYSPPFTTTNSLWENATTSLHTGGFCGAIEGGIYPAPRVCTMQTLSADAPLPDRTCARTDMWMSAGGRYRRPSQPNPHFTVGAPVHMFWPIHGNGNIVGCMGGGGAQ